MKYLGFHLNPNDYRIYDWTWLLQKFEKIIDHWAYRWLSLGGRMILIKSFLQKNLVYWLSLAKLLAKIKSNIHQICTSFLWKGARKSIGFHLVKWEMVSKPKFLGGWGFRNLHWFSQALVVKSLWRALFGSGLE
jgi:hypothetical protein